MGGFGKGLRPLFWHGNYIHIFRSHYFGQCLDVVGCFKDRQIMNYKRCEISTKLKVNTTVHHKYIMCLTYITSQQSQCSWRLSPKLQLQLRLCLKVEHVFLDNLPGKVGDCYKTSSSPQHNFRNLKSILRCLYF